MIFTGKEAEEKFKEIFGTNKDWEQLIDEGYEKCDQQEYNERQLGLINYGDETYYFTHKDEFEKDWKIAELEEEILRLKEQLEDAVIPKFKIGQEVWNIHEYTRKLQQLKVDWYKVYGKNNCIAYRCKFYNKGKAYLYFEKDLFTTKEEAQKELNKRSKV